MLFYELFHGRMFHVLMGEELFFRWGWGTPWEGIDFGGEGGFEKNRKMGGRPHPPPLWETLYLMVMFLSRKNWSFDFQWKSMDWFCVVFKQKFWEVVSGISDLHFSVKTLNSIWN